MTSRDTPSDRDIIRRFNQIYYDRGLWQKVKWLGKPLLKYPTDLFIYAEIISQVQPGLIIECGTYCGGSAWFMATVLDLVDGQDGNDGWIISIDPHVQNSRPQHPRIHYLRGGSTEPATLEAVKETYPYRTNRGAILVVLDSDHAAAHVAKEMDVYAPLVTVGSYLIVEDTNLNGHPVVPHHGPGPHEAVESWLPKHPEFVRDEECDRLLLSANPGGYLKRIK